MKKQKKKDQTTTAYATIGVGMVLILVGLLWKQMVPPSSFWSEEDAIHYVVAAEEAHAATSGHAHGHLHEHIDSYDYHLDESKGSAKEQFEQAQASLSRAKSAHSLWGHCLSALGAVVAFGGMVILRSQEG